ncbi:hypothetical protein [Smaragdicoccus niigatensis]|uniref:hypothetical protein n=1 Tax=Smaragdicoccus niigatensis TaxID=359359 RepID=UPI0003790054|nr:hypothetical protein [Smaragdicoccus niigatensis]
MHQELDGWLGFAALVLSVACIPVAYVASSAQQETLALISALVAFVFFGAAGLLLHHSEVHHGFHLKRVRHF